MNPEIRLGSPFRASGRTLTGRALTYGDIFPEYRERFLPGAFEPIGEVPLNLQHDHAITLLEPNEYVLSDNGEALEVRATLPERSAAIKLIQRGALNGFSVEFHAKKEYRERGIRVIEKAELVALALVDHPSYPQSTVEVRRRGDRGGRLGTFRGRVPVERKTACKCGPKGCVEALFQQGAFDNLTDPQVDAFRERDVLSVVSEYGAAIGSGRRKSLRFWKGKNGDLEFAIDIPATARGRELMDTFDNVDLFARPVIDLQSSTFDVLDDLATYSVAQIRALNIMPTDNAAGWTPLVIAAKDAIEGDEEELPRRRNKIWLP